MSSDDHREFDLATMEFVARLKNGHTLFQDVWLEHNYDQPVGFYARPLDRKWVVINTALPNVKVGDVLSKIDGIEVETYFRQHQKYISASSEAAQRHNFFLLPYLLPLRFIVTLEDGRKINVDRSANNSAPTNTSAAGRWLRQNTVAYIQIPSFATPLSEQKALDLVGQFQKARTIIFDVRNNEGGLMPRRLLQALMDKTYRDWKQSTPIHISALELSTKMNQKGQQKDMSDFDKGYLAASEAYFGGSELSWGGELVSPQRPIFHGQLIFLVDGGCASACEALVGPFKNNLRAILVGETTEGTAGPAYMIDLGDGMQLGIAATRQYFPDGSEFEGIGINPDIEVHPTIDDLRKGRDVILDKAMELASRQNAN
ncbi:MAG TPA: S41 family peptidase [Terriglobales bacterium]